MIRRFMFSTVILCILKTRYPAPPHVFAGLSLGKPDGFRHFGIITVMQALR